MQATAESTENLLTRLTVGRRLTDDLFRIVRPDSLYERPIAERHRIIFYLGHLEAFDWNLISERLLGLKPFQLEFDGLFAFGIDPVGGGLPSDQTSDWPSIPQVGDYCAHVREKLDRALERFDYSGSLKAEIEAECWILLNAAIEHRLMHAETLAYMLHQLPLQRKIAAANPLDEVGTAVVPRMISIPGGTATLGLESRKDKGFGWDNEFQAHTVHVSEFEIDQYKMTNRQYLEFITAGGYEESSLWTEGAWQWIRAANITHPVFWKRDGVGWLYRTMFHEIPLPLDWPVFVSHAEASAFARAAGKALPTEAQWHRAAYCTHRGGEMGFPWGSDAPDRTRGNFDFRRWDPEPVDAYPAGRSSFGVADLVGNGWEWTSTVFEPFPGFKAFPFYPGYSANFFDRKHYVLKGGSPRTAACMLRRSFRNWFQPHYQYVYAGFRCVNN